MYRIHIANHTTDLLFRQTIVNLTDEHVLSIPQYEDTYRKLEYPDQTVYLNIP